MPLPTRHEHDHFPVPKAAGGKEVVPVCLNCHDLKDRTLFADWDLELVYGLTEVFSVEVIESFNGVMPDHATLGELTVKLEPSPDRWREMTTSGRLAYAKVRAIAEHGGLVGRA